MQKNVEGQEFPFQKFWELEYANIPKIIDDALVEIKTVYDKEKSFPIKEASEIIFGFASKQAKKITASKLFKDDENFPLFDYHLMMRIILLSKEHGLNKDLIFKEIENYDQSVSRSLEIRKSFIKELLVHYNEKRVINLIFNANEEAFDTDRMLQNFKERGFQDCTLLPKKPQNMLELHDNLSSLVARLDINDFNLRQREDIIALDGKKILDGEMVLRVPKVHSDLVLLGEKLNFCIGNGFYSKQVEKGSCSIVSIFSKERPLYAIQFNRYMIKQAYGFNNTELPKEIISEIEKHLISKPEIPEDFIEMQSSFIYGYKYDNENMYFMLSNGGIYMYCDVSNEVYEKFLVAESKGSFFSKVIKKEHECVRMC